MHADDMDDFCKTAWHLVELVEKDKDSTKEMRQRASRLRRDADVQLCRYAANVEKHGQERRTTHASLSRVDIRSGYGVGRYGRSNFGVGEQSIVLKFANETTRDALEFAKAVLSKWEHVFAP